MKINLNYIKDDIQKTAEAIKLVLNIDVTIVDENMSRIAGTGTYFEKIGKTIKGFSAFKKAFLDKENLIIDKPRQSSVCQGCYKKNDCKEFAEVCCPIILEGKCYGVMGLIAFNKEQSDYVINNSKQLLNFLNKMTDMISSKLKAEIKSLEYNIEKKKLNTILNNINKAVVSVNSEGCIEVVNDKFIKMFVNVSNGKSKNMVKSELNNEKIFNLIHFISEDTFKLFKNNKYKNIYYGSSKSNYKGIYNVNKIIYNKQIRGYVIDFVDTKETIKNYNKINVDYRLTLDDIIGKSENTLRVKKQALLASQSMSTVLITGESGTGKEMFARAIHSHSNRNESPFIALNCAAIPEDLLESELFGYEEGAFTGAKKGGKLGMFEIANKGSVFLDEIGDMSLHLQAKLLRFLQEKEVSKIGSVNTKNVDVRIIAATNKNLEKMVKNGSFREDLYYRLNVIPINLPSLSNRKKDIPSLVEYMIKQYSNKLNKNVEGVSEDVLEVLKNYSWPGNIRELQNVIEFAINMETNNIIDDIELIKSRLAENKIEKNIEKNTSDFRVIEELDEKIQSIESLEKKEIKKALKKFLPYKKDKILAAQALGISKATLYRKMKKHNIVISEMK